MDGSPVLIGLLIFLVCCSAFFSASETALTSLSRIGCLRNMVEENVKNADLIMRLLEDPNRLLSSILVGNNLVNNGASALTTTLAIQIFRGNSGGAGIATIVITVIILIFGEITPKTIAAQKAEKVALAVVKIISFCVLVFRPVVAVLNVVTGGLIRLLGCNPNEKAPLITEAELKTMVNVSHEEGVLELDERTMINNVFDFGGFQGEGCHDTQNGYRCGSVGLRLMGNTSVRCRRRVFPVCLFMARTWMILSVFCMSKIFSIWMKRPSRQKNILSSSFFTYERSPWMSCWRSCRRAVLRRLQSFWMNMAAHPV